MQIADEEDKMKRYKIENARRKHNYLPLIVEILKLLAKDGKLVPLYERAKAKTLEKEKQKISKVQFKLYTLPWKYDKIKIKILNCNFDL